MSMIVRELGGYGSAKKASWTEDWNLRVWMGRMEGNCRQKGRESRRTGTREHEAAEPFVSPSHVAATLEFSAPFPLLQ